MSRIPSEIRKAPKTMYAMASPGGKMVHQVIVLLVATNVKESIWPQVKTLTFPNPKKLTVASSESAKATPMVIYKKVKCCTLGSMCLKIIRVGPAPLT
jgi:hypothetical protein